MWLYGWLAGVLLLLAMWSVLLYGWLAMYLAVYMGKAILAGKFQGIFGLKIAEKSPQNHRKIPSKSPKICGIFGGFQPDFGTAKTKTEKPKTQNPHQKPRKENPKKKTQNPFK